MYPYIDFLGLNIPSYGLCMAISVLLCGFLYIQKACKLRLIFENMIIIAAVSIGAGLLSGGLLYIVVTYSLQDLYNYVRKGDFSFITNGGLVFYGGLIGGISGALISCKKLNVRIEPLEVCALPYLPLGHAIGRIGCMMAGCCHGFEYDGIFAVKNKLSSIGSTYFPVQVVEAIFNLLIMLVLLLYTKKQRPKYHILYYYLMMYSIMRFCLEFFRGDEIRGGLLHFSTSQWISLFIFAFCVLAKYFFSKKNKSMRANS